MKIRKFVAVFVFTLAAFLGLSGMHHEVSAAKYGAKLYTTPKAMRGTWHYKKGKSYSGTGASASILHPYSKIKITKHTITFYRKSGKRALKGKYTLYKAPNKKFSLKKMAAAEKYATKHKWLAPYSTNKKGFGFSTYWLHAYQQSATGTLTVKGKTLKFTNAYFDDTFKK